MIGERIRTYRNMFGATQQDLADALDVTRQTVAAWESGSRDLGVAMLLRIAKTIGIPVSALLEEDPYLVVVDAQDLAHLVQVALRHEEITESKTRELLSGWVRGFDAPNPAIGAILGIRTSPLENVSDCYSVLQAHHNTAAG